MSSARGKKGNWAGRLASRFRKPGPHSDGPDREDAAADQRQTPQPGCSWLSEPAAVRRATARSHLAVVCGLIGPKAGAE